MVYINHGSIQLSKHINDSDYSYIQTAFANEMFQQAKAHSSTLKGGEIGSTA